MSVVMSTDPYHGSYGAWERGKVGKDVYQTPMHCPYCGAAGRHEIVMYEGAWFRLRCRACAEKFKVRCRAR